MTAAILPHQPHAAVLSDIRDCRPGTSAWTAAANRYALVASAKRKMTNGEPQNHHSRGQRRRRGQCQARSRRTIIATSAGPKGQHASSEPAILHCPSSARRSASSPRPALRSPHRHRARASAPADTTAPPAPATGFLLTHLAGDEAPLRACAQRSSVVPGARPPDGLVLWKA